MWQQLLHSLISQGEEANHLFSLQLRRKLWRMESQCYSRREQEMKHL